MCAAAECLMDQLGCEDLFDQSGLNLVRETSVAGQFADKRGATAVRLVPGVRPDLALQFASGDIEVFELVEADVRRERGREYKDAGATGKSVDWPVEEWATPEQALDVIHTVAFKKAAAR
jgi:hypothetical protein